MTKGNIVPFLYIYTPIKFNHKYIYIMYNPFKSRAKVIISNCNGDINLAKKITFNNAQIASLEDDDDRLDAEASIYHYIKEEEKKKGYSSK